ncbi:MAG: response regulator [Gammaproteobacteria bacterium]|nr:response regulator [Gammaproteobacteria bacterium]
MSENYDILIAEDDEQISFVLQFMLEREGFSVFVAKTGQEALDILTGLDGPPKLCLFDVMMPYVDGFQLVDYVRNTREWASVPVVMLTAKSQEKDIIKGLEAGANDYVIKPFQPNELATRLKLLMKRAG